MKPMMDLPTVRIEAPDGRALSTKVFIDDVEQTGLTHVSLDIDAKYPNGVEIMLDRMASVHVNGKAKTRDRWEAVALVSVAGTRREYVGEGGSLAEALRDVAALVGRDERNGMLRG